MIADFMEEHTDTETELNRDGATGATGATGEQIEPRSSEGAKGAERVQLSRRKGWKMPDGVVNVARPSRWGNPFKVGADRTQREAVRAFRAWLTVDGVHAGLPERKAWILGHLGELRGKSLACWCKPGTACHADVLMELANG